MFLQKQKSTVDDVAEKDKFVSFFTKFIWKKPDVSSKISAALPWQGKSSVLKRAHHRASRLKEIQIAKINNVEVLITLLTSRTQKMWPPQDARV